MRTRFDRELETLNLEMIQMGSLIERSIESTVKALIEKDIELAQEVIGYDKDIDDMEREIETRCLRLLLQQQPTSGRSPAASPGRITSRSCGTSP